jgi:hypothetical protein
MEKNKIPQTGKTLISGKEIDESVMDKLRQAHQRVEDASRGGSCDWDGGGNPHRMMEEMEREYAWKDFCDLCRSYGLDPSAVRQAM